MPQNLSVPNSVRSVAGISAQSTGALTELKKLKFVFGIQIVYFSEILRAKYPKLEYWSDENPSVITSRWRKRHFGITLFENTNFSTFKFSFKIPKTPPKIGTFQNQKTRGGENGMIFPGGENGISPGGIRFDAVEDRCTCLICFATVFFLRFFSPKFLITCQIVISVRFQKIKLAFLVRILSSDWCSKTFDSYNFKDQ